MRCGLCGGGQRCSVELCQVFHCGGNGSGQLLGGFARLRAAHAFQQLRECFANAWLHVRCGLRSANRHCRRNVRLWFGLQYSGS